MRIFYSLVHESSDDHDLFRKIRELDSGESLYLHQPFRNDFANLSAKSADKVSFVKFIGYGEGLLMALYMGPA